MSELAPVELWKEEGNVDITVGACIAFGIRTKEVGGGKRRIMSNDRRSRGDDF